MGSIPTLAISRPSRRDEGNRESSKVQAQGVAARFVQQSHNVGRLGLSRAQGGGPVQQLGHLCWWSSTPASCWRVAEERELHAPLLAQYEVASVLTRKRAGRELSTEEADRALRVIDRLNVIFHIAPNKGRAISPATRATATP